MKFIRDFLDAKNHHFGKGGKLEKFYPLYEMADTFVFTPGEVTRGQVHVRDGLDLKRTMVTVVLALLPCIFMAVYNTGLQANLVLSDAGETMFSGWRGRDRQSVYGFPHYRPGVLH